MLVMLAMSTCRHLVDAPSSSDESTRPDFVWHQLERAAVEFKGSLQVASAREAMRVGRLDAEDITQDYVKGLFNDDQRY